ncbi:hypothetical protein HID58_028380, partial [Brassica napus]
MSERYSKHQNIRDSEKISNVADFSDRSICFCINRFKILMWCISSLCTWVMHKKIRMKASYDRGHKAFLEWEADKRRRSQFCSVVASGYVEQTDSCNFVEKVQLKKMNHARVQEADMLLKKGSLAEIDKEMDLHCVIGWEHSVHDLSLVMPLHSVATTISSAEKSSLKSMLREVTKTDDEIKSFQIVISKSDWGGITIISACCWNKGELCGDGFALISQCQWQIQDQNGRDPLSFSSGKLYFKGERIQENTEVVVEVKSVDCVVFNSNG